jgi:hypothetical protein
LRASLESRAAPAGAVELTTGKTLFQTGPIDYVIIIAIALNNTIYILSDQESALNYLLRDDPVNSELAMISTLSRLVSIRLCMNLVLIQRIDLVHHIALILLLARSCSDNEKSW